EWSWRRDKRAKRRTRSNVGESRPLAGRGALPARWVHAVPFLEERPHRLAAVVGEGARRHGLDGAGVGGGHVELPRVVEHPLAERLRGAAAAARGEGEALRLLVEVLAGHDPVDESPRQRRLCVDGVAGERHLEGALATDAARDRDHGRVTEPPAPTTRRG